MNIISKCIKTTIKGTVRREIKKVIKLRTTMKTRTTPWMDKVLKKIAKERKAIALKSSSSRPLANTTSMESKCSDENIVKRVQQCVVADKINFLCARKIELAQTSSVFVI